MKYRLPGLCAGLIALAFTVACGGGSDSPEATSGASANDPTAPAGEAPTTAQGDAGTEDTQDPVAIVNDEEISRSKYDRQLDQMEATYAQQGIPFPQGAELAQLRQQVLQQLVQQTLVLQETEERDITATSEEVEEQYQATVASFPDEATFNQTLESEGLTKEDLESLIDENIRVEKLLTSVVDEAQVAPPTEEEMRELYELARQQQELPPFEEVRSALEAELVTQRETEVIQAFIQELEASSEVEILVDQG